MDWIAAQSGPLKVVVLVALAIAAHLLTVALKRVTATMLRSSHGRRAPTLTSVWSLISSIVIFAIYFVAFGFILSEFGVSIKAYLASASVIGLAVGFGSQGLVQDVVTGMTLVFSDLIAIGDMVEIGGQVGIVRSIGMRFVVLRNSMGAYVYVPNKSITNVVNYPRGYVRCLIDVELVGDAAQRDAITALVSEQVRDAATQFEGINIHPPSIEGRTVSARGKEFVRAKFRIWPNRGAPLEGPFRQELLAALRAVDPGYADWMIGITYEVEKSAA